MMRILKLATIFHYGFLILIEPLNVFQVSMSNFLSTIFPCDFFFKDSLFNNLIVDKNNQWRNCGQTSGEYGINGTR